MSAISKRSLARNPLSNMPNSPERKLQKMTEKLKRHEERIAAMEKGPEVEEDNSKISKFHPVRPKKKTQQSESSGGSTSMSEDDLKENARMLINPRDLAQLYFDDEIRTKGIEKIRVKLIVTALSIHDRQNPIKNLLARWTGVGDFGVVHTAVQIGPVMLEWNDSSIVIPCPVQDWASCRVLFAVDVVTFSVDQFMQLVLPVCEVVARWNGVYEYNEFNNNCQAFSSDVLQAMGLSNQFDGKIGRFLQTVGTTDPKKLTFYHKLPGEKADTEFRTHTELDQYCEMRKAQLQPESEDYRLLKAYDRVFWLRYYAAAESTTLDPALRKDLINKYKCIDNSCFFLDPSNPVTNWRGPVVEEPNYLGY